MAKRTGRSDLPTDPAGVVRALGVCRQVMLDVLRTVKPMGPAYHAASMVVSAIDGFAAFLTGERYHFSAGGSTPVAPHREGLQRATSTKEEPPCP